MECDSMHSTIERKLVSDIFIPCDYVVLLEVHKDTLSHHVTEVYHDQAFKLSGNYITSLRLGQRAGSPTVNDLEARKYTSLGPSSLQVDLQ